jgi:hypothetical protein
MLKGVKNVLNCKDFSSLIAYVFQSYMCNRTDCDIYVVLQNQSSGGVGPAFSYSFGVGGGGVFLPSF